MDLIRKTSRRCALHGSIKRKYSEIEPKAANIYTLFRHSIYTSLEKYH